MPVARLVALVEGPLGALDLLLADHRPLADHVLAIVEERVVVPDVIASYELVPSIFNADAFEEDVIGAFETSPQRFGDYTVDQVRFEWRAWLNMQFLPEN